MTGFDAHRNGDAVARALIDFLSEELGIPRRNVCIVSGHSSRSKIIEVSGVEIETVKPLAD